MTSPWHRLPVELQAVLVSFHGLVATGRMCQTARDVCASYQKSALTIATIRLVGNTPPTKEMIHWLFNLVYRSEAETGLSVLASQTLTRIVTHSATHHSLVASVTQIPRLAALLTQSVAPTHTASLLSLLASLITDPLLKHQIPRTHYPTLFRLASEQLCSASVRVAVLRFIQAACSVDTPPDLQLTQVLITSGADGISWKMLGVEPPERETHLLAMGALWNMYGGHRGLADVSVIKVLVTRCYQYQHNFGFLSGAVYLLSLSARHGPPNKHYLLKGGVLELVIELLTSTVTQARSQLVCHRWYPIWRRLLLILAKLSDTLPDLIEKCPHTIQSLSEIFHRDPILATSQVDLHAQLQTLFVARPGGAYSL